ncbi:unnamed protein product, partial [Staurois parvus]
ILNRCVQWFCTEQPGSSSSRVPRRLSWLLLSGAPTANILIWGHPLLRVSIHIRSHGFEETEIWDSRGCCVHRWIAMGLR